jgi:heterodisulfide reductase subunit A2
LENIFMDLPAISAPVDAHRIGVIICGCGGKISTVLDTACLAKHAATMPDVVFVKDEPFPCSRDGLMRVQRSIQEYHLDRIVLAGCTPRLVEKHFQKAVEREGLAPDCLEVVDIREQCTLVHDDQPSLTQVKAQSLIAMGISRIRMVLPGKPSLSPVVQSALVIGGGLGGLTTALAMSENNIAITLVESEKSLGSVLVDLDENALKIYKEKLETILANAHVKVVTNARIIGINGSPGDYQVDIHKNGKSIQISVGVILITSDTQYQSMAPLRGYKLAHIITQAEFHAELTHAQAGKGFSVKDIVFMLCVETAMVDTCSLVCCLNGIRQAIQLKELNADSHVTVLFDKLFLGIGGEGVALLDKARKIGVSFLRYAKEFSPVIEDQSVMVTDQKTGEPITIPFNHLVLPTPQVPAHKISQLAALFNLPTDSSGFLIESRHRLRPGRYIDDGIFAVGGAHRPADAGDIVFQSTLAAIRAKNFLSHGEMQSHAPVVSIDPSICTGCASCIPSCPSRALSMEKGRGLFSISIVNPLRCTGCGNCVVECPVHAIDLPGSDSAGILDAIQAGLSTLPEDKPRLLAFACEWSANSAAELAGARKLHYPPGVCIMQMSCSARFDPDHILWAFLNGADGVWLGACMPGECHHGMGNSNAQMRSDALRKQLANHGFDPDRLRFEFMDADNAEGFVSSVSNFYERLDKEINQNRKNIS